VSGFELLLFSTDCTRVREAVSAGVAGVVVDWERRGKCERQRGFDTQINADDADDLRRVRACTQAGVLCRINGTHPGTPAELEEAIEAGADEVLIPMVRRPAEVEAILDLGRGRAGVGILVETLDALQHLEALARLPLARVYVGLNDLSIERGTRNLFEAVVDGTVERVRAAFDVPFGFAGLTLPEAGMPVPCRLLIGEMARLGCSFTMLRRSFLRDMRDLPCSVHVPRLLRALEQARERSPACVLEDRRELERVVKEGL
jgi:hypothetical protein